MNVAVVGSRTWTSPNAIFAALEDTWRHICGNEWPSPEHPQGRKGEDLTVVSGGAAGADSWAEQWAAVSGMDMIVHEPEWARFGRSAGYKRNKLIIDDADLVLAFQRDGSRGTQHSIDLANKAGVPVIVWTWEEND